MRARAFERIAVVDVELTALDDVVGLDGYADARVLARLHGAPIGHVLVRPAAGRLAAETIRGAVLARLSRAVLQHLVSDALATGAPLDAVAHPPPAAERPLVTVAVCTRDRPEDLARCLAGLAHLRYPALELLVVDNAPASEPAERLVRDSHPRIRYVREERPGLDHARNRAVAEARGSIVAFTDDDAVADPAWVDAIADAFAVHAEVACVTGLVVPLELETEAQVLFEESGGFGRGYERRWYRAPAGRRAIGRTLGGAGMFGTGANMAFRRDVLLRIGPFDPALDAGTVTRGGGDLDLFFRVLKAGHTLMYEPSAIVRHRHRRDVAALRRQLRHNGIGLFSYFVRNGRAFPEERWPLLRLGAWWICRWHLPRLARALIDPGFFPPGLVWAELWGSIVGLRRYRQATLATGHADDPPRMADDATDGGPPPRSRGRFRWSAAVRTLDLARPVSDVADASGHDVVRLFPFRDGRPLGGVDVTNHRAPVSAVQVCDAVAQALGTRAMRSDGCGPSVPARTAAALDALAGAQATGPRLDPAVPVSIVVATCDRPDDLRRCLRELLAQETPRPVEIVVVDNRPGSGCTPPVVAEYPGVRLVREPRAGVSYARNAGIVQTAGTIVVSVDDDVTTPPAWLETLLAPLARPDVMVATGPLLPVELETEAQLQFEAYGGLVRGFERREADARWFAASRRAVPTWLLGGTGNAAFRATIFSDPRIGLLDEALGPGTPTGVGEDTYLFYRVLAAGYSVVYEPAAYAWHRHRRTMRALARQIYAYSKGHVAYQLTTLLRDGDYRALARLALELPLAHLWRAQLRVRGHGDYTIALLAIEAAGNLAGPLALWRSRRRVRRLGRSVPYPAPRPAPDAPESGAAKRPHEPGT